MYQVKTFIGYSVENEINEWLKNQYIDVISIQTVMVHQYNLHCSALEMWDEWKETTILYRTKVSISDTTFFGKAN